MMQVLVHYGLHFIMPLCVAYFCFRTSWKMAYIIMLSAFVIDLDHLLASPLFDPNRCSINYHPLHSYYAIVVYVVFAIFKKTRLLGLGLIIHIIADQVDCLMM